MTTRYTKSWEDLSLPQQTAVVLLGIVQIALLVTALVDIRRRPPEQIKGTKRMWTLLAFINFIGPLSYFVFGRKPAEMITLD